MSFQPSTKPSASHSTSIRSRRLTGASNHFSASCNILHLRPCYRLHRRLEDVVLLLAQTESCNSCGTRLARPTSGEACVHTFRRSRSRSSNLFSRLQFQQGFAGRAVVLLQRPPSHSPTSCVVGLTTRASSRLAHGCHFMRSKTCVWCMRWRMRR